MGALPHPDSSYSIPPLRARAHPAMPVHSHPCESSAGTPFFKPRLTETRAWPGEEKRGGQGVGEEHLVDFGRREYSLGLYIFRAHRVAAEYVRALHTNYNHEGCR